VLIKITALSSTMTSMPSHIDVGVAAQGLVDDRTAAGLRLGHAAGRRSRSSLQ
jgi:hypothetical protein